MGYLQCQKCGENYKLDNGESLDDFAYCSCGGSLIYKEKVNQSKTPEEDTDRPKKIKKINESDSVKGKNQGSPQLSKIGLILMFIGFFCLIFAFFYPFLFFGNVNNDPDSVLSIFIQTVWIYLISIILMIIGAFLFLIANIGKTSYKKQSKAHVLEEYLKELPGSHTIFRNVRIPKTRTLISHVIIGPNGIFIIQKKTFNGKFIIKNEEWWRVKGNQRKKSVSNPGKLVKMNSVDLKRYLESHNVNIEYLWITPIVSFPQGQFTVEEEPKNYHLISPENILEFILSQEKSMDPEFMMKVIALIARCSL